ncbi:hypothetical protein P3L10_001187 [Capsicum annuum]
MTDEMTSGGDGDRSRPDKSLKSTAKKNSRTPIDSNRKTLGFCLSVLDVVGLIIKCFGFWIDCLSVVDLNCLNVLIR